MVFEDIKMSWKGQEYTCTSHKVFKLIRELEKTGLDLASLVNPGGLTDKSEAISICLKFMGMPTPPSAEECYLSIYQDGDSITHVILALQLLIVPPDVRKKALEMTKEQAEIEAEKAKKKMEIAKAS